MSPRTITILGLSAPQFFSLVSFLIAVISIWVHMEIRLAEVNIEIANLKEDLMLHKVENRKDFETIRADVNSDTKEILRKIDEIQIYLRNDHR